MEEAKAGERELEKRDAQLSRLREEAGTQVKVWQDRVHSLEMQLQRSEDLRQRAMRAQEDKVPHCYLATLRETHYSNRTSPLYSSLTNLDSLI